MLQYLVILLDNLTSCYCSDYVSLSDTEEQRQCLGCCNQEDTCADDHHNLLLEILLIARNVLIINTDWDNKMTKETN